MPSQKAHKAESNRRHPSLIQPFFKVVCLIVSGFVSFGRPGVQYHACFVDLVGGILSTWNKCVHLLFNIVGLIGSVFGLFKYFTLAVHSFRLMFRNLRKHLVWKLASFSSILFFMCQSNKEAWL